MRQAPWYKRYPTDFMGDPYVQAMTAEQYGWFSAMLDASWIHSPIGRLPNDFGLICKMIGRCDEIYFRANAQIVLDRFKTSEDGKWLYHPRMKEQADKFTQVSENKSHPGKAGRKKKQPNTESGGNQTGITPKSDDLQNEIKRGEEVEVELDKTLAVVPDGVLNHFATLVVKEAGIPASFFNVNIVTKSIQAVIEKEHLEPQEAVDYILEQMRAKLATGERVNRWWFENGGYIPDKKPVKKNTPSVADEMRRQLGIVQ